MTQNEFFTKRNDILDQIGRLRDSLDTLQQEYLEEQIKCKHELEPANLVMCTKCKCIKPASDVHEACEHVFEHSPGRVTCNKCGYFQRIKG